MSQKNDSWGFSHTKYFLAPLILSMLPHEYSLSAPTQHGFNGLSNFEEFPAPRKKLIDRYSCFSSSGNWKNYSILLVYTLFSHITCSIHVGPTCRPHMSCEGRGYIPGVRIITLEIECMCEATNLERCSQWRTQNLYLAEIQTCINFYIN